MSLTNEEIISLARKAGFVASVGRTDRDGKYHPDVNALSKSVPIEWLERFAAAIIAAHTAKVLEGLEPIAFMASDEHGNVGISLKENVAMRSCEAGNMVVDQLYTADQLAAASTARDQRIEELENECRAWALTVDNLEAKVETRRATRDEKIVNPGVYKAMYNIFWPDK